MGGTLPPSCRPVVRERALRVAKLVGSMAAPPQQA